MKSFWVDFVVVEKDDWIVVKSCFCMVFDDFWFLSCEEMYWVDVIINVFCVCVCIDLCMYVVKGGLLFVFVVMDFEFVFDEVVWGVMVVLSLFGY